VYTATLYCCMHFLSCCIHWLHIIWSDYAPLVESPTLYDSWLRQLCRILAWNVSRGIDPFAVLRAPHATLHWPTVGANPLNTTSPWARIVGRGIDPFTVVNVSHHALAGTGFHTPPSTDQLVGLQAAFREREGECLVGSARYLSYSHCYRPTARILRPYATWKNLLGNIYYKLLIHWV